MKNLIAVFLCLLSTIAGKAQFTTPTNSNEKFIELKVTDTMMVNPDAITLKIAPPKVEKSYYYDQDDEEDAEQTRKKTNDAIALKYKIEEVLNKNKVNFKYHEEKKDKDIFSKDMNIYENAYEVHLNKPEQLEKLKTDLNTLQDVSIVVTNAVLADKEKYELQLVEKIMKKAEREATAIAKAMNVSLGQPLNVSNQSATDIYTSMFNNPESMGGFGALFSMMGNLFKNNTQQNTQVTVNKTLVIRYAIK